MRPVHPSAAIEADYRKRLETLIDDMHDSILFWIKAAYRKNPPQMAQDESAAATLRRAVRALVKRWNARFDGAARDLATYFATDVRKRSDAVLRRILKDGGFSIEWTMTPAQREIAQATVEQSVGLIKSIPQQYLGRVETMVMQSVQTGRDLGQLTADLQKQFGVTRRRAAFISKDQNNKATAAFTRARQVEIGVKEAIWLHSGGGREPRPTHVAAGRARTRYKVDEGWFDPHEGRNIFPGELINCFPGDTPVRSKSPLVALWRAYFNGPMIHVRIGPNLLKGTPNHPILTARGWVPLGEVNSGDQVVCMTQEGGGVVDDDKDDAETSFADLFESLARIRGYVRRDGGCFNFYGDRPDGDVDQIIIIDNSLLDERESGAFEDPSDLSLAKPDGFRREIGCGGLDHIDSAESPRFVGEVYSVAGGHFAGPNRAGVAPIAHDTVANQDVADIRCRVAGGPERRCDRGRTHAIAVHSNNLGGEIVPITIGVGDDPESADLLAQFVSVAADGGRSVFEFGSISYEFRSVRDKVVVDFSGHVYTLQNLSGHYSVGADNVQAKNCRCVSRAVIEGFT